MRTWQIVHQISTSWNQVDIQTVIDSLEINAPFKKKSW